MWATPTGPATTRLQLRSDDVSGSVLTSAQGRTMAPMRGGGAVGASCVA
jgi:hypothetical protein